MLTSLLLPLRCPLCGARGAAPCGPCAARVRGAPVVAPVPGCTTVAACFRYDDAARELLLALKYRNRRDAVAWCGAALAGLVPPSGVDAVTWAPTTARRVRARGFDQAEVLARATARVARLPVRPLLARSGHGRQTGAGAAARRLGPAFAARARPVPARVLLVDDIGTTGSTLARAAAVLRAAGAVEVHARTVAWTPAPHRRRR